MASLVQGKDSLPMQAQILQMGKIQSDLAVATRVKPLTKAGLALL